MTYKQGVITACEVCYDGKGERTGEVQGDPLAESPEEEGHILLSCELSSKALWCSLGTLGKYWSTGVPWHSLYFTENILTEFSASSQLSLLVATSYSTAGHSDYSCLPMRDAGMTNKRLKVKTTKAVVFHQEENHPLQTHLCYKCRGGLCFHASVHATLELEQGMLFGPTVNRWAGRASCFLADLLATGHWGSGTVTRKEIPWPLTQYSS